MIYYWAPWLLDRLTRRPAYDPTCEEFGPR